MRSIATREGSCRSTPSRLLPAYTRRHWPRAFGQALTSAADYFRASHVVVHTPDVAPKDGGFIFSHNVAPEWTRAYDAHYRLKDAWTIRHHQHYRGREGGFTGDMLIREAELVKQEFYADFLRPQGLHHYCSSLVYARPPNGDFVSLGMFRGPRQERFEEIDRRACERLAPHLQRALVVSKRLQSVESERRVDAAMLDSASVAIFLVDQAARITRLTGQADQLLREGRYLRSCNGRLMAVDDDVRFAEVVRSVTSRDSRAPFSRVLVLHDNASPGRVHVLVAKAGMQRLGFAYVVVSPLAQIGRRDLRADLRAQYGLTPAEARLCETILAGLTLNEAADRLSIKRSTAVSQLKSAFAKTRTTRQTELLRLLIDLSSLPRDR